MQVVCGIQDLLISKEFSEQESSIIRITTCSWKQNRHVHITTTCRSRLISSKLMQVVCGIQNLLKSKEFSEQESSVNYMFLKAEPTCAHHDNVSIKADIIENDAGCVWNYNSRLLPGRRILIYISAELQAQRRLTVGKKLPCSCSHEDHMEVHVAWKENRHVQITTTCRWRHAWHRKAVYIIMYSRKTFFSKDCSFRNSGSLQSRSPKNF